jgi:hypothetical protein
MLTETADKVDGCSLVVLGGHWECREAKGRGADRGLQA